MDSTYINTNGIRLHAVVAGPADGPLVVLLHGFPEFWYGWRHQIEPLARAGFRVVAPDQRGYNLSDKPPAVREYGVDRLVADVTGVLDALGRKQCFLAGHDWGAAVAWATALFAPDRVEKLAVLNVPHPAVMLRFLSRSPRQILRSWYIGFFQLPRLPEYLLRTGNCRGAVRILAGTGKPTTFRAVELESYVEAWKKPQALRSMVHWYRALARYRPRLPADPRVRMPTLVLWGRNDVALDYSMVQPSLDLCDQGRLVTYDSATHWVQHDEKDAVTSELLSFFLQGRTSKSH